mmetsp:Transcript_60126/g.159791  ORF Transcript_60126/g.159791 Transcript_60126/m.159791 type:complete len:92 (+) Transcript_60126:2095-2370(+)
MSPQMQRYMKARSAATGDSMDEMPTSFPSVIQINPEHAVIKSLKEQLEAGQEGEKQKRTVKLLYHVAAMKAGYEIGDSREFATLVTDLMSA